MATTTIGVELSVGLASFEASMRKIPGITDKEIKAAVAVHQRGMKAMSKDATTAIDQIAKEGGKLGRIAELTGGQLGTSLRGIKGIGELAAGGINTTTVALGAAGLAIGALVAGGSAFIDVMANLDKYRDTIKNMQATGLISAEDVANIEKGSRAFNALMTEGQNLAVFVSTKLAPAFTDFALGAVYAITLAETFSLEKANAEALKFYKTVHGIKDVAKADVGDPLGLEAFSKDAAKVSDLRAKLEADDAKIAERQRKRSDERRERIRAETAAHRAALLSIEDLLNTVAVEGAVASIAADEERTASLQAFSDKSTDAFVTQVTHTENLGALSKKFLAESETAHQSEIDRANAEAAAKHALHQKQMQDTGMGLAYASQINGSLGAMSDELYQRQVDNAKSGSKEQKKALHDQAVAHKATMIIQAVIDTAAASVGTLAAVPGPAGIALAVVEAALGAASIGVIASSKIPSYHTGGLINPSRNRAPDEVPIMAQTGEGMLTRQGMQKVGGEQGLRDLNHGTGSAAMPVINVIDHHTTNTEMRRSLGRRDSVIARAVRQATNANRAAGHRTTRY